MGQLVETLRGRILRFTEQRPCGPGEMSSGFVSRSGLWEREACDVAVIAELKLNLVVF